MSKQQQSSDWGAPKLSEAQIDYAASDVLHLHAIKAALEARLSPRGAAGARRILLPLRSRARRARPARLGRRGHLRPFLSVPDARPCRAPANTHIVPAKARTTTSDMDFSTSWQQPAVSRRLRRSAAAPARLPGGAPPQPARPPCCACCCRRPRALIVVGFVVVTRFALARRPRPVGRRASASPAIPSSWTTRT